ENGSPAIANADETAPNPVVGGRRQRCRRKFAALVGRTAGGDAGSAHDSGTVQEFPSATSPGFHRIPLLICLRRAEWSVAWRLVAGRRAQNRLGARADFAHEVNGA